MRVVRRLLLVWPGWQGLLLGVWLIFAVPGAQAQLSGSIRSL